MRRGRIASLAAVALAATAGLAAAGGDPPAAAADSRPNFVFVMTDDQALADQKTMHQTNTLIGGAGTNFTNAFATEPLCCPARASILTGQYSHNHGVLSNLAPLGSITAFQNRDNTLPVWLDAAGYRTGFVGKYLNGPLRDAPEPGWDRWVSPTGSERLETSMYDYDLLVDDQVQHFGSTPDDYKTDVFTRFAQNFIQDASSEPFALFVWDTAPHDSGLPPGSVDPPPAPRHEGRFVAQKFQRPPSYNEAGVLDKATWNREKPLRRDRRKKIDTKRRYRLGSLQAVDDQVAAIVAALERRGVLANTVFVFTSDNGYLYGEHRLGSKSRPYEESVRVPLLIRGPGFPPGSSREDLVALHDLTATMVSQAGAVPGRTLDGNDLISSDRRGSILLECLACGEDADPLGGWQMLRTKRQAYISYGDGQSESYDLKLDPWELDGRPDPRTPRLTERLEGVSRCAGGDCP